jgi:hypothetical protein
VIISGEYNFFRGREERAASMLTQLARATALLSGSTIILCAFLTLIFEVTPRHIFNWCVSTLGASYLVITAIIMIISVFALLQYRSDTEKSSLWIKIGQQSNTAIATIALTYTLCGISLGVGSLATLELGPETINSVISQLTEKFSMAFMTSVVGLPLSAFMRFVFVVNEKACNGTEKQKT